MHRITTKYCIKNVKSLIRSKHTLPDLPYDFGALEPVISAKTIEAHYLGHHADYVKNLNILEEKFEIARAENSLTKMITIGYGLKFNGGGHLNHSILWNILCPNGTSEPTGDLAQAINNNFGSFQKFVELISLHAVEAKGSGWTWLGYNKELDRLEISDCPNQDPLFPLTGLQPLFGIDLWEHAYYLDYINNRKDYVKNIFKIANWRKVEEFYAKAKE